MFALAKNSIIAKIQGVVEKATKNGKIYIFLTLSGGYFSSLIFILFIISLSYGNSLAYLCSFLFLSVIWVSCIVTNYNLGGIDFVRIETKDFYFEDEEKVIKVFMKNNGKKTRFDLEAYVLKGESNFILELAPGKTGEVEIKIPQIKKGVYSFKKIDLRTTFPFGIFRSWKPIAVREELLIIPRPEPCPMPLEGSTTLEGKLRTKKIREEFLEHAKYTIQEASKVDWKIYARRGELYYKEFDSGVVKNYELNPTLAASKLVYQILEAHRRGATYSLTINGRHFAPEKGRQHLLKLLKEVVR